MYNLISHPFITYSIVVTMVSYVMVHFITRYFIKNNTITGMLWLSVLMIGPLAYSLEYSRKSCIFIREGKGLHYLCFLSGKLGNILFPLLILFLAYALFRTSKGIYGYYKIRKTVSIYSLYSEDLQKIIRKKLDLAIPVYIVDLPMGTVFTLGFLNPKIYISKEMVDTLEKDELGCILIHEAGHGKSKDNLLKLILIFVRDLMFFNPLVDLALKKYFICREISCDKGAATHFSQETLNKCYIKVAKQI
ncbi:M56 family metallopeptidase [Alkalicella caledoniensis]|uniref:M56 family metallopeptidase n=1 Tax=Alkalicella caledoniensis TaxID=2731377 RepID=A0A7G9W4T7_ALKCA|nr:M56 family metallopeptidase [Alkalicella caledoniensis]QNO13699.1 M56 family metallopeptidase [Alkalicella caledoniensis]